MRQPSPSTALRGPKRISTEGPGGTARMRQPPPGTAIGGLIGSCTDGPQWHRPDASATTQHSASWSHRGLHRRPQWYSPHASATTQCSVSWPIGSPTEGPSGTARMRQPPLSTAF
eukprot:1319164-Pyramimonas_sp.AAC.1